MLCHCFALLNLACRRRVGVQTQSSGARHTADPGSTAPLAGSGSVSKEQRHKDIKMSGHLLTDRLLLRLLVIAVQSPQRLKHLLCALPCRAAPWSRPRRCRPAACNGTRFLVSLQRRRCGCIMRILGSIAGVVRDTAPALSAARWCTLRRASASGGRGRAACALALFEALARVQP